MNRFMRLIWIIFLPDILHIRKDGSGAGCGKMTILCTNSAGRPAPGAGGQVRATQAADPPTVSPSMSTVGWPTPTGTH